MSTVDEIKNRLDIVDLVSETVKLRKAGKSYSGFCPFHENRRTPAFAVFPDSGTWRCFGECNEGGDIFKFVMKKEGWDFSQTLKYLAERAGIELEPLTPKKQEEDQEAEHLRTLLEEAVQFYRHQLLQTKAGAPALDYLKNRGLLPETVDTFGIGYAPDSWDSLSGYFTAKGFSTQDLIESGLASERQEGSGVYDRFRNRIIFPIRDAQGKMAGFGARILNPDDVPKFLNSPQTRIFDKGRLLYGLDLARKPIREKSEAVIVEGYLDVIMLHQAGYKNTVSPMGTALTEDQIRQIKRFSRRIILALDADAAGAKATLRGLEVARQAMDHTNEVDASAAGLFHASGLLRSESRLQADLRVTTLPAGMDPDEVVMRDKEEWGRILQAAQPIVIHVMNTLVEDLDLDDPKAKSEIAAQVLPLIKDVPDPVERDGYLQRLSRLLKIDERTLMTARPAASPSRRRRYVNKTTFAVPQDGESTLVAAGPSNLTVELERHVLRLLLRQPDMLYILDRSLQRSELKRFAPEDFEQSDHQILARLIIRGLEQDEMDTHQYIGDHLPAAIEEQAQELLLPVIPDDPGNRRYLEDLVRSVLRLRQVRIGEGINQLRYLQEDMQNQGEVHLEIYHETVVQYTQVLSRINQALGKQFKPD